MPVFNELLEVRRPWADWVFLRQERDTGGGGGFVVHNPWGHSTQPQGDASRNRLEIGYRTSAGSTIWGQLVLHGPTGRVGLGTVAPQARLHVNGDIIVTGDIRLPQADLAEDFVATEVAEPGSVMVLDDDGGLIVSTAEYDHKVAGVVSGAGEYRAAIVLDHREDEGAGRLRLAMVGKTYCKVDADRAPIAIGDLLTTSATAGHAMKATDPSRSFGATLGKALRPLEEGTGLIPILATLQ